MKLQRSNVTSEDEGKINWPANAQIMYIVSNFDEKNKFGEPRGYRIMPSRGGGMHLTIQESDNLFNSQSFATHQLYVTKQHDYEQAISHAGNAYDPREPIIDFADYFNGESLVQEDLVLWFNLGMHHVSTRWTKLELFGSLFDPRPSPLVDLDSSSQVPHTGDIPNTVQTTAQASMMISPVRSLLYRMYWPLADPFTAPAQLPPQRPLTSNFATDPSQLQLERQRHCRKCKDVW